MIITRRSSHREPHYQGGTTDRSTPDAAEVLRLDTGTE